MSEPLWTPSAQRVADANLTAFIKQANDDWGVRIDGYDELYLWSVDEIDRFWTSLWTFGGVVAERRGETALRDADKMPGARFFPEARLNFAQNLLQWSSNDDAIRFLG